MSSMEPSDDLTAYVWHLLRLVGVRGAVAGRLRIALRPGSLAQDDEAHLKAGGVLLTVQPGAAACAALGLQASPEASRDFDDVAIAAGRHRLRTLHPLVRYAGAGRSLLDGAWREVPRHRGTVIVAGSDLAGDLLRYRHGDPGATPENGPRWDFAFERPMYLYEAQLAGLARADERQADLWSFFAAGRIADAAGLPLADILPGGAPGAIVITGDDDQAFLEKYAEQLQLLEGAPVTYFLHPLTKHTPQTMADLFAGRRVELGLHPDALDAPERYAPLLHEQCEWFERLTGRRATSVRNHGFLNDGYWGHLGPWLDEGIAASSNLPGLDGRPLDGSFLPARVWRAGELTRHWSVVTAIGDGVRYVDGGRSSEDAGRCVLDAAEGIRSSGIPGVLVLNLHPQNVADTRHMHLAAMEVIRSGFQAWTLGDCIAWFERAEPQPAQPVWRRAADWMKKLWVPAGAELRA